MSKVKVALASALVMVGVASQARAEPPPPVEQRGGIQLTTADGSYQMQLGAYAQGRYSALLRDGDLEPDGFSLRRVRWIKQGKIGEPLSYRFMIELANQPLLFDAYADWKLPAGFFVRVGRDKVPLTRTFLTPAAQITFSERAVVADAHRWARDLGAQLFFVSSRASGQVGVGNGAVDGARDRVPSVFARAQAALVGPLFGPVIHAGDIGKSDTLNVVVGAAGIVDTLAPATIGGISLDLDTDGDGRANRVLVLAASGDVTARLRGFELATEVFLRREHWRGLLAANPDLAAVVGTRRRRVYLSGMTEATYTVIPRHLLVGARIGYGDLPFLSMRGASSFPRGADALELSGVVMLYRGGRRTLGATYSLIDFGSPTMGGPRAGSEHRMVLEAQLNL